MEDEEIRQFMAQVLSRMDVIVEKVTKLYDQTDAAMWERAKQQPEPPPRRVTDEEYNQMERERLRREVVPTY